MCPLRVLMFSFYFPPSAAVASFRALRFMKYLPDYGCEPLVVTVLPGLDGQTVDPGLAEQLPKGSVVERTNIWFPDDALTRMAHLLRMNGAPTPASLPSQTTSARGAKDLDEVSRDRAFARLARNLKDFVLMTPDRQIAWKRPALRAARKLVREYRPQILYSTGPPHSAHLIAATLKRKTGLPWIADFRDPWARRPWTNEENPWGRGASARLERRCVEQADAVVLNTIRLHEEFRAVYPDQPPEKFHTITNGFDPDVATRIAPNGTCRCSPAGKVVRLLHPGELYGRRDPRPLLLAIKQANRQGVRCVFEHIGGVDPRFQLEDFVRQNGLEEHVSLRTRVPHASVLQCMAQSDVLVIVQPDTKLQIPAKLFEMLLFRKPILAVAGDGETSDVVKRFNLGAVCDPCDSASIAAGIEQVVEARTRNGGCWDQALAAYDGRRLAGVLADLLKKHSRA